MRSIAFYLPQFHPVPENDEWWGAGFTDWTNVVKATPQYRWHHQPDLPADLGFYDLRLPETRHAQADLARAYRISGFCYFHYWFHGRRILERPFDEVLRSGAPDLPFCLCWANENWTRVWDGGHRDVLLAQTYSEEDDYAHASWLARAFQDPRYIRVDGRPLFLVYRALQLPDPLATTARWRQEARRLGIGELFLCRVESFGDPICDPRNIGFDASVEFMPDHNVGIPGLRWRFGRRLSSSRWWYRHQWVGYELVVKRWLARPAVAYPRFPCVTPAWDNTPRRRTGGMILRGSSPGLFEGWVAAATERTTGLDLPEALLFVNAWNEWAEGNHLEPGQRWGRAYLEAHRRGLDRGLARLALASSQSPSLSGTFNSPRR